MKLNKYKPLSQFLSESQQEQITLTFREIEAIIQSPLPYSARTSKAWWSNRTKGAYQASAWTSAGYQVKDVNVQKKLVTFAKNDSVHALRQRVGTFTWDAVSIKAFRSYLGLNQAEFATKIGVRQQTISEWENNIYIPRRAMSKYLTVIAESNDFFINSD